MQKAAILMLSGTALFLKYLVSIFHSAPNFTESWNSGLRP